MNSIKFLNSQDTRSLMQENEKHLQSSLTSAIIKL